MEQRRQRLRAEPQRGVLAPCARPGCLYLHRGQGPGGARPPVESRGQRGLLAAVQAGSGLEPGALRLRAGTAAPPVQEV